MCRNAYDPSALRRSPPTTVAERLTDRIAKAEVHELTIVEDLKREPPTFGRIASAGEMWQSANAGAKGQAQSEGPSRYVRSASGAAHIGARFGLRETKQESIQPKARESPFEVDTCLSGVWKLTILGRYTMLAQRDQVGAPVSVLHIRCILDACIPAGNMQRSGSGSIS